MNRTLLRAILGSSSGVAALNIDDIAMDVRLEPWRETSYADDDPVSTATDRSGNSNNLTCSGSARPLFKTNQVSGRAIYRFDGTNDYLLSASIPGMNNAASRWYFVVAKYRAYTSGNQVTYFGENTAATAAGGDAHFDNGTTFLVRVQRYSQSGSFYDDESRVQATVNTWFADSMRIKASTVVRKFSGVGSFSEAKGGTEPNGVFKLMIGAINSTTPALFAQLDLAAMFCGHQDLSDADLGRIEAYVAQVFGVAA